jgi:hypothetical protein
MSYNQADDIKKLQDWLADLDCDPLGRDPDGRSNIPPLWWELYWKLGRDAGLSFEDCQFMDRAAKRAATVLRDARALAIKAKESPGDAELVQAAREVAQQANHVRELRKRTHFDTGQRRIEFEGGITFGDFISRRQAWAGLKAHRDKKAMQISREEMEARERAGKFLKAGVFRGVCKLILLKMKLTRTTVAADLAKRVSQLDGDIQKREQSVEEQFKDQI